MRFQKYINENDIMSWFKGSEVRRGKRPLTLYRGISKTVEDRHASAALGIFATDNLNIAKSYGSKVLKVYMKITNPYYMEYDEIQEIENKQDALRIKKEIMKKGHDGIFLKPIKGSGSSPYAVKEYIAFNKTRVQGSRMRFQKYITEAATKVEFVDSSVGMQSGQMDMRLEARINGKRVGYLDYSVYNDEVSIKFIEGSKQHKGVGKQLILKLQSLFPKTELNLGMSTTKGSAMLKAVKSKLYVDKARLRKIKKLEQEYKKLKAIEQKAIDTNNWDNWDNDIYDRQYEIEEELRELQR